MSNESIQNEPPPLDDFRTTIAGIWLFTMGALSWIVLPGIVGAVAESPGFGDQSAGFIGAAQTFGSAFGLLIPSVAMTRFPLRRTATAAVIVLTAFILLSMLALGPLFLAFARFGAGAAEGLLLGIGIGILSSTRRSDVLYAAGLVAQFTAGALILYNLPTILGVAGFHGLLAVFLVLPALAPMTIRWIPEQVEADTPSPLSGGAPMISRQAVLALLAFGLFYAANGGSWAYAERIGAFAGLTLETIGTALSLSMLGGIGGSGAAALLASSVPRAWNLLIASALGVMSALTLTLQLDFMRFAWAVFLINFSIGFAVPFYLAVLADRDQTGRLGSFSYVLNLGASGVGPAIAALLVSRGYDTLLFAAAGIYVLGYLVVLPVILPGRSVKALPHT